MANNKMTKSEIKKLLLKAREYNQKSTDIINKIFDYCDEVGVDLRESPSNSYNADCIADSITCYVAYDEYEIDKIVDEITSTLKENQKN